MRRYDLVIFDLDGTLADTKEDLAAATNHTLVTLGMKARSVESIVGFVGGGLRLLLERALASAGADPKDPVLLERATAVFVPWYREHMLDATHSYPGTEAMLQRLAGAGVNLSIATNKPRIFTAGIVDKLFPHTFDPVVACGDDAPRKPDPSCVALARGRWPTRPERTLFVGDSTVDILTARAAGVHVASCAWGFGERTELAGLHPEFLADSVGEIGEAVLGGP